MQRNYDDLQFYMFSVTGGVKFCTDCYWSQFFHRIRNVCGFQYNAEVVVSQTVV